MADEAELAEIKAVVIRVAHLIAAIVARHLVHLTDVLGLTLVHIREVHKYAPLGYFLIEDGHHFKRCLAIKRIAILGLYYLIALDVVQARKMFIIDVLDIDPLDLEVSLELEGMIFPPEWEGFLMIGRFESGYSLKHAAFDCAEEEVGIGVVMDFSLP